MNDFGAITDRQPPRSLEAERGVLGSMLLLPEVCDDVALAVRAEEFYDAAHQKLFGHLLAMHESGRIDSTLLVERLKTAGDLERIGGVAYIAELIHAVPTAAHAVHYAKVVRNKAMLRSLIYSGTEILRDAYDETSDPRETLSVAEQRIFRILDGQTTANLSTIANLLRLALDRIEKGLGSEPTISGVTTGFVDFDNLTGGLRDSELVILAARPSMGKTALALNIAEHVSLNLKVGVLFVSLEMSATELADRLLCSFAEVNGLSLRIGKISQEDRRRLLLKAGELSDAPLHVDDTPSRTITEIAAAARRLKRNSGLGLIVIDYLQLIEPDNPRDPRQEQVSRIARRLKGLARELKVPVLCLAQLNRQAEVAKENRPRLSHLRESGAIEQDADVVMFVHREEYYQTNEDDKARVAGEALIILAKQRNGPIDDVPLTWRREFTRFGNSDRRRFTEFGEK